MALVPEAYLDLEVRDVDLQVLEAITEPNETGFYLIWPKRLTAQETIKPSVNGCVAALKPERRY